ncbi:hypothetical protein G7K_3694-t1 [Saitoella complicata NRRL Y-17804]|uniref:Golgi apyrase n=1 Tax=Saitoella complicata (strain BCRC 22490 / CBS 7301 / JCM 7358 / NBRC 10748 / NRRL Y-17804) TaxID=698492 RepID=A0A0E9NJG6_SAICN|nr:hypothetical protein G7K_3694-t1 [Saitoella complicata NRRL Y-17804]
MANLTIRAPPPPRITTIATTTPADPDTSFFKGKKDKEWDKGRKYGVVFDAGSSGTRVQVYSWLDPTAARAKADEVALAQLPRVEKGDRKGKKWQLKVHPGISTFAQNPAEVGTHLAPLLEHALSLIPPSKISETPIFLLATAGMRLLTPEQQSAILAETCAYTRAHTSFLLPDCSSHIQVIPGEVEALYGWLTINYLLDTLSTPPTPQNQHPTYGFLDMGGASAQIAFAPNATEAERHDDDLYLVRLRTVGGVGREWRVFVSTWLGFGANEARRRHLEAVVGSSKNKGGGTYADPCLPPGALDIETVNGNTITLEGTGQFEKCLNSLQSLLGKDAPCPDYPCLFNGVHAPLIDFDINHFLGVSEYWHASEDIFDMGGAYDYVTYSSRVQTFCSKPWTEILTTLTAGGYGKKVDEERLKEACFKAGWMLEVLHDGIGVPRLPVVEAGHNGTKELEEAAEGKGWSADAFRSVDKIDGTDVSWTLGRMVLYASSQVSLISSVAGVKAVEKVSEMVGFGPNKPHAEALFQPGGEYLPLLPARVQAGLFTASFRHTHTIAAASLFVFALFVVVMLLMIGPARRAAMMRRGVKEVQKRIKWGVGGRKRVMDAHGQYVSVGTAEDIELEEGRREAGVSPDPEMGMGYAVGEPGRRASAPNIRSSRGSGVSASVPTSPRSSRVKRTGILTPLGSSSISADHTAQESQSATSLPLGGSSAHFAMRSTSSLNLPGEGMGLGLGGRIGRSESRARMRSRDQSLTRVDL